MVLSERVVLKFFILICTISGLSSAPYNHPSLGILSDLISKDSNSPLIVVVDASNHARSLDMEPSRSHSKSYRNHDHRHNNDKDSTKDAYEALVYDILRTNQILLENQRSKGSDRQLAEQCSDSQENSCSKHEKDEEKEC